MNGHSPPKPVDQREPSDCASDANAVRQVENFATPGTSTSLFKKHPLIVFFDPIEEAEFRRLLRYTHEERVNEAAFPLIHGTIDGRAVSAARLPFGDHPELLASSVRSIIKHAQPGFLVVLGSAMALDPNLAIGTVVTATRAEFQKKSVFFGTELLPTAFRSAPHDIRLLEGVCLTMPIFVNNAGEAAALRKNHPSCNILEMEDFHLGEETMRVELPMISFRAVTDRGCYADHKRVLPTAAATVVRLFRRFLRRQRQERMLAMIDNPPTIDLPFRIVVRSIPGQMRIPQAVSLARRVMRIFPLKRIMKPHDRLDLILTNDLRNPEFAAVPSGIAHVSESPGHWMFLQDAEPGYARLIIDPSFLDEDGDTLPATFEFLMAARKHPVGNLAFKPDFPPLPSARTVHIQGLNSISAEAEEGLLAGCLMEEFQENGYECLTSDQSTIWTYRTAHAASESYFVAPYPSPDHMRKVIPDSAFLIATGLGPAIEPAASGGDAAHLLMPGDEFGGRLINLLEDLSSSPFSTMDVFRHEGIALRAAADTVLISRIDRRSILTPEGLNELRFEPQTLRRIYSLDYDRFLADYFFSSRRREYPSKHSYLLLTSRGCGNRCSICCSGAYQPFTALAPERIFDLLHSIRELHALQSDEYVDVYFLDSYFNRNPQRIIALADRLERAGLRKYFEFYVRHNGLHGFLWEPGLNANNGKSIIHVDETLINAYCRLGIDEIVMGIDSFTDTSIRLLKTDINRLAREGATARPAYTFAEIVAVLTSIEAAGLKSRCFLLLNNPFVDDRDRIETFYNLLMLSLDLNGFQIDYTSSSRVNELKPFPGAPLTQIAAAVPGLIRGDRFDFSTALGKIEEVLSFELFGERRSGLTSRKRFMASARSIRARLTSFLAESFDRSPNRSPEARREVAGAVAAFLRGEEMIRPRMQKAWQEFPDVPYEEERLAKHTKHLAARLRSEIIPNASEVSNYTELFHRILKSLYMKI
ncbi:MAG: hypothetical protein HQM09_04835 [Candidatus Riflebacteria bacterium]|nr:hypothetical protein [Candidatus Riflebacteria bacterium]